MVRRAEIIFWVMLVCGMALFGFSDGTELETITLSQAIALIIFGLIGLLLVRTGKQPTASSPSQSRRV